jgi:hypothetical protein
MSGCVRRTVACAGLNTYTPEAPELHLDVSSPKRHLLHLDVVCTTGAWKFVPLEMYEILYMEIITEFCEILSNYATRNAVNFRGILGNSARNTEVTEVQKAHGITCCHDLYPIDILHLSFKILCLLLLLLSFLWNETTTWTALKNAGASCAKAYQGTLCTDTC